MMSRVQGRLRAYARLTRLHKPIGTLLLLWPTLWALWVASRGDPNPYLLFAFCVGTLLMRSAGCAMNDWADRDFDKHVARTKDRPVTAGLIAPWEALVVASLLSVVAFALVLPMNSMALKLSFVAIFLAASYPFTKRFFAMPQAYLGIAFGFGIPMAFAAVGQHLPPSAWWMLLANVFWAIAYDTEYAMVDREDDLKIGIKTAAITFASWDRVAIAVCYACALALLFWVGELEDLGPWYRVGLLIAGAMAVYHLYLIRRREPAACFAAFNHNNWLGGAIFLGLVLDYWF
jgi:4-hydroxybenzoate polyprenyltransferase